MGAWLLRLPVLPFAVGIYLPLWTTAAVFLGGVTRWWLTRGQAPEVAESRREQGILFGSGLVGGAGLTGVLLAMWVFSTGERISGIPPDLSGFSPTVQTIITQALALGTLVAILLYEPPQGDQIERVLAPE